MYLQKFICLNMAQVLYSQCSPFYNPVRCVEGRDEMLCITRSNCSFRKEQSVLGIHVMFMPFCPNIDGKYTQCQKLSTTS